MDHLRGHRSNASPAREAAAGRIASGICFRTGGDDDFQDRSFDGGVAGHNDTQDAVGVAINIVRQLPLTEVSLLPDALSATRQLSATPAAPQSAAPSTDKLFIFRLFFCSHEELMEHKG